MKATYKTINKNIFAINIKMILMAGENWLKENWK